MVVSVHFVVTLITSCAVGGFWVGLTTWVSEKAGGTLGGLVGGLPALEAVTSISLGLVVSQSECIDAMLVCPIVGFVGTVSYLLWVWLPPWLTRKGMGPRWGVTVCVVANLIFWLGISIPFGLWGVDAIVRAGSRETLLTVSVTFFFGSFVVGACMKFFEFAPPPKSTAQVGWLTYVVRSSLGSLLMLSVVGISKLSSVLAGVLCSFPIFSLTSFSALWLSSGPDIVSGVATTMGLGVVSAYGYTVIFGIALPSCGVWWSFVISMAGSFFGMSVPLLFLLKKRDETLQRHLKEQASANVELGESARVSAGEAPLLQHVVATCQQTADSTETNENLQ
eukprot:m51a1_g12237 hypothetical protein (336) ;mRNA; f:98862-100072